MLYYSQKKTCIKNNENTVAAYRSYMSLISNQTSILKSTLRSFFLKMYYVSYNLCSVWKTSWSRDLLFLLWILLIISCCVDFHEHNEHTISILKRINLILINTAFEIILYTVYKCIFFIVFLVANAGISTFRLINTQSFRNQHMSFYDQKKTYVLSEWTIECIFRTEHN